MLTFLDRFAHLRVLVIGDAILDCFLQGGASRICREAPVPIVDIERIQDVPGGAANTAANVASLGGDTYFLTVVGMDDAGDRLQIALEQQGVQLDDILCHPSRRTLIKQRVMAADHLVVRFDQGSTGAISEDLEDQLIERLQIRFLTCDAVIISDYGYGILTPRVIDALAQLQAENPRVIVADSKHLQAYAAVGVTAVKPNYGEATALLNLPSLLGTARVNQITREGQRVLTQTKAQLAAITLDVDGALIFMGDHSPTRTLAQPAPSCNATGAGDTYVASLALALAAGADANAAATLAGAATAITTLEVGTTCCELATLRRSLSDTHKRLSDQAELLSAVEQIRNRGKRIVFTNGCFDLLHSGHVTVLEQAKALGDVLMVGVNTDESIRQLKGDARPVNGLGDRLAVLAALGCVDYVIPFGDLSPRELIRLIRPDVYTKGGDYTRHSLPETPLVEELGGEVIILPYVEQRSTTGMIQSIRSGRG
ncbi:D-glycero-beta-D-manno-heptose 1-phosphate adenylyltransferase [Leptolyngbya sp. FACHB-16]|nr:D-glycero-beta-D-manno-heptose 1-phosphate adenylyltransferase [Leptolyngbya sp. FACHB-8]MBD2153992.1 D-glycero-beta-D-manno-heptose 1-phosphate adenylyltransferase [Leptolyngbya sp. FACHB-16]